MMTHGTRAIGTCLEARDRDTWIAHPVDGKPRRLRSADAAQRFISRATCDLNGVGGAA